MIRVYDKDYGGTTFSIGDNSYPVTFKSTNAGGTFEKKVFLRHAELTGPNAEASYGIVIGPVDLVGSDQSTWFYIAPDNSGSPGTYGAAGASVSLGDVLYGQIKPFWIKAIIPADPNATGYADDVKLSVTSAKTLTTMRINTQTTGSFSGAASIDTATIDGFKVEIPSAGNPSDVVGSWTSAWISMPAGVMIKGVSYTSSTGLEQRVIEYRTSSAGSDITAAGWVTDPSELNSIHTYVQIRITFNLTNTTGLRRRWWSGNQSWSGTPTSTQFGVLPSEGSQGGNYSTMWDGWIYIPTAGDYTFNTSSDDYGDLYIDGAYRHATNVSSNSSITTLTKGWHTIQFRYYQGGGAASHSASITPPGGSSRAFTVADFASVGRATFSNLVLQYQGQVTYSVDTRLFNGPDTPTLISPSSGSTTYLFSPELTALAYNVDTIEFQMDTATTFDTGNLAQWTAAATPGVPTTSTAPSTDRPSGTWYWRVRGVIDGVAGAWTDWWSIVILPISDIPAAICLNVSDGLETLSDMQIQLGSHALYHNVSVGIETDRPVKGRAIYSNANVAIGIGEVIYPLYDKTAVRKTSIPEEDSFT